MVMNVVMSFVIATVVAHSAAAQQLVLVKKNVIKSRFFVGQEIQYSLRSDRLFTSGVIRSISDSSFVTHTDTVMIRDVGRVGIGNDYDFVRSLGIKMLVAGVLLQLGDYLTVTLVQDLDYAFNPGVTLTSASMIVTGVLIQKLKKPYVVLSHRAVLMSVTEVNPLYQR